MGRSFLPTSDEGLEAFALNFSTLIGVNYAAYGISQSVATTYSSKYNTYRTALQAAKQPPTRGNATVLAKNTAKKDLEIYTRMVARTIGNNMNVTDAQRQALGLNIRKKPTPNPAPTSRPSTEVLSATMRMVGIRVWDDSTEYKRSKAPNTAGAKVYTFIGAEYPSDPTLWAYQGDVTNGKFEINFPNTVPSGSQVWICAAWYNRKGETGPISFPVSTNIQGGGVQQEQEMKLAA